MLHNNDDMVLRGKQTANLLGISLSMVYKLLNTDKTFPKGTKMGKIRVWLKSDLLAWVGRKAGR